MIKIKKSKDGQYYFTVHAKNGAVLVTSEMYTRKSNARKGAVSLAYWMNELWNREGDLFNNCDVAKL
jgi:uncharacterized protein YegP (UPF0339 family)